MPPHHPPPPPGGVGGNQTGPQPKRKAGAGQRSGAGEVMAFFFEHYVTPSPTCRGPFRPINHQNGEPAFPRRLTGRLGVLARGARQENAPSPAKKERLWRALRLSDMFQKAVADGRAQLDALRCADVSPPSRRLFLYLFRFPRATRPSRP